MSIQNPASDTAAMQAYLAAAQIDIAEKEVVRFHTAVPGALFRSYLDSVYGITSISGLTAETGIITLSDKSIENATGISYATGLTGLYMTGNSLTSVGDISALTSLVNLELFTNNLTDIGNVSQMTSLTNLKLYSNQLTDIGSISALTAMSNLRLQANSLTSVGDVSALTSLTAFNISQNQFAQAELEQIVDDLFVIRVQLGANSCSINLSGNPGSSATAVSKVVAIDALITNGCTVTI